jgi:hypothetical protein
MPAKKKTEANKDGASSGLAVGAGFGSLRECATKVERAYQRGTWDHCPERVVCSFVDRGERVPLCERCARNVRNGAYGARLRDLLNEQVPNAKPSESAP